MDNLKAIGGNSVAWGAVAASYATNLIPWAQLGATVLAGLASLATAVYFIKKAKKL